MTTFLQFVVLGVGVGAVYSLLALGLVTVYRASGIINFAQSSIAVLAGFILAELTTQHGWPVWPTFAGVVVLGGVFGMGVYWLTIRPLREASQLTRVISTLGVFLILQGIASIKWGSATLLQPPFLPGGLFTVGGVAVSYGTVTLFLIAVCLTVVLWAASRFTLLGLAIRAVSENRRATAAAGWSPDAIATTAWGLGGVLGAAAGMLVAPITGISTDDMTLLLVAATAAALAGGFSSFPLTLLAAIGIGVAQAELSNYVNLTGASDSFPFLAILVILGIRGRGLPARGHVLERFSSLGSGRIRWTIVLPAFAVLAVLIFTLFSQSLNTALISSGVFAIILLSIVLLTGLGGQLSLAQMALAGLGAVVAGRLVEHHWAFLPAALVAIAATIPFGLLFALPALRARGLTLALMTFGLGAAVSSIVFANASDIGSSNGTPGTPIGTQSLFGWSINASVHPDRYALVVVVALFLCGVAVSNFRRSGLGRQLIAVRGNERAAAALGVNVYLTKLYAFGLSAAIAAVGGVLLAFQFQTIDYSQFDPFVSILVVAYAVIGGIGFIAGAGWGALLAPGGLFALFLSLLGTKLSTYVTLIGGVGLLMSVLQNPNGVQDRLAQLSQLLERRRARPSAPLAVATQTGVGKAKPSVLKVTDLTVRFGAVRAVNGVSLTVRPGQISALIGPNGAGKTTMIDAITGFVRLAGGSIELDGVNVSSWPAHRRAIAGISRSFQSLELFDDISVRENLLAAAVRPRRRDYLTRLLRTGREAFPPAAMEAIREFELEGDLDRSPSELSYGKRRLVAVARAVASRPSILLLDEPVAGLDETEAAEFSKLVSRLAKRWGLGVLIVEHDMGFVMRTCDDITVIDFGQFVAHGEPTVIAQDPKVIAAYLGEPLSEEQDPAGDRADVSAGTGPVTAREVSA